MIALITLLFFCVVFTGLGLGFTLHGLFNLLKSFESKKWKETTGKIISSQVVKDIRGNTKNPPNNYRSAINYEYLVDSIPHLSTRYCISDQFFLGIYLSNQNEAQARSDAYPVGSQVTVYYNPLRPSESVLISGIVWKGICFELMLGGAFLIVGLIADLLTWAHFQG